MGEFDKSSKWLIQHHGDSILRLAGVHDIVSWKALQSELVQPGQLPDGCVEVQLRDRPEPAVFIIEIATYPERRLESQLWRDTLLVLLDRNVVPETLAVVLRPKGKLSIQGSRTTRSPLGGTQVEVRWRVVNLWTLRAEELLAIGDPGLAPWVPLTEFAGAPEPVLHRCRELIEREPDEQNRNSLLAVTQVLAKLRFSDATALALFGGRKAMIESPLIQEIVSEAKVDLMVKILRARFGQVPADLEARLRSILDQATLDRLGEASGCSPDLESFRAQVPGDGS